MNLPEPVPNPLSIELLDTHQCRELSGQLHEFENAIFGPDFSCEYGKIKPWVDSGCLFYAAVCGEAVAGRRNVRSVASVLITNDSSRDRLLNGEIADYDLLPWPHCSSAGKPVIYFSSVVSDHPDHLAAMYDSLLEDLVRFLKTNDLSINSGFSIATGPAGYRHMAKCGFCALEGRKYLQKYDVMVIDVTTAKSRLWCSVFGLCAADPRHLNSDVISPEPQLNLTPASDEESARDIERRLTLAKAERYRNRKDW